MRLPICSDAPCRSPTWGARWVAVYLAVLLTTVVVALFGGTGLWSGGDLWGTEWHGRRGAARAAATGEFHLLTATELPHVDPETGLAVACRLAGGGSESDATYAAAWNSEIRSRIAKSPVPRRFDGRDVDGASILRRFAARASDVATAVQESEEAFRGGVRFVVCPGTLRVTLRRRSSCEVAAKVPLGTADRWLADGFAIRQIESPAGALRCVEWNSWLPNCGSWRALLSEDGRTLWLAGIDPAEGDDAVWTAAVDVATAFTLGVDLVRTR